MLTERTDWSVEIVGGPDAPFAVSDRLGLSHLVVMRDLIAWSIRRGWTLARFQVEIGLAIAELQADEIDPTPAEAEQVGFIDADAARDQCERAMSERIRKGRGPVAKALATKFSYALRPAQSSEDA